MHSLPLSSRILFLLSGLFLPIGSHLADYSRTHIFNPKWMPHAKFHTGQTLAFSLVLGLLTIWFAWRKSADLKTSVLATASFASAYWICQDLAILYPGTRFFDPDIHAAFFLGIAAQVWIGAAALIIVAIACFLALRTEPMS